MPGNGTTYRVQGPPTSINNKRNAPQTYPQASLMRQFFCSGSFFPAGQVDKANCDIFSSSSALSLEVLLCINFYMGPVCHQEMPPDTCLLTLSVPISLELLERKASIEKLPPSNSPRHAPEGHGLDCWFLQEGPAYCGQVIWGCVRKLSTDMQASQQAIFKGWLQSICILHVCV